jgi:hypothetical protein
MDLIKDLLVMIILGIIVYNLLISWEFVERNCHFIIKFLLSCFITVFLIAVFLVIVFIVVVFIYYGFSVPEGYNPAPF